VRRSLGAKGDLRRSNPLSLLEFIFFYDPPMVHETWYCNERCYKKESYDISINRIFMYGKVI